jgi:hypothetical protein
MVLSMAIPLTFVKPDHAARHYTADWTHSQTYIGWGPAEYYGEDVIVEYYAKNKWTHKIKDGYIHQTLK